MKRSRVIIGVTVAAVIMVSGYALKTYAQQTGILQDSTKKKGLAGDIGDLNTDLAVAAQNTTATTQGAVAQQGAAGSKTYTNVISDPLATQAVRKELRGDIRDIWRDRKALADAIKAGDPSKIVEQRKAFGGDIRDLIADLETYTKSGELPAWIKWPDWREIQRDIQEIRESRKALADALPSGDQMKIAELRKDLRGDIGDLVGDVRRALTDDKCPSIVCLNWQDTQRDYRDVLRDRELLAEAAKAAEEARIAELRKDLRGDAFELRRDIALNLKDIKKAGWDQGEHWEAVQDYLGEMREDRVQLKNAIKDGDTYKIAQYRRELSGDQQQLIRNLSELYRDRVSPCK